MTTLSASERDALCDLTLEVGADAPTLCESWTVLDLVVHLLVREGSPAAVGIVVPALAGATERVSARWRRRPLTELVARLRSGPPRLSPLSWPGVDTRANTLEMLVHHEDVRRAQEGWEPRTLDAEARASIWSALATPGKALTRKAPVGVVALSPTEGSRVLHRGTPEVTVAGDPTEITLYLFGRREHARVALRGSDDAVARFRETSLGA